jgi:hypothetical protein
VLVLNTEAYPEIRASNVGECVRDELFPEETNGDKTVGGLSQILLQFIYLPVTIFMVTVEGVGGLVTGNCQGQSSQLESKRVSGVSGPSCGSNRFWELVAHNESFMK